MGASRKGEREPGKSDQIDALAVARAVVKDGVEQFPVAYLDEQAMEIRLLLDHRDDLVAERTRTVNRLRWHLLELCPELERSLKRGALNQARVLDRVDRRLRKLAGRRAGQDRARAGLPSARPQPRDRRSSQRELRELVKAHRPQLLAEQGCGALTAAILIGHTAGVERFRSDAELRAADRDRADPVLLGQRTQHRLNRGGDRQLNHALHIIAITRAQHDPATKEYLARKEAEGKTKQGRAALPQAPPRPPLLPPPRRTARRPAASHGKPITEPELPTIPARPRPQREVQQIAQRPPDGLHQLDRRPRPAPGLLRPATADGDRSPTTSPAANRRDPPNTRPDRRQPTRSQPFCRPRRSVRDRQHPPFRLSAPRSVCQQPGAETPK